MHAVDKSDPHAGHAGAHCSACELEPMSVIKFSDIASHDNSDGSARNGFSQSIYLYSQTNDILGQDQVNAGIYKVTYHRSFDDAQNGNNALPSAPDTPISNQIPDRETIYIRIENTDTGCINAISQFDVIVNPEPTFVAPTNLAYCDDDFNRYIWVSLVKQ